MNAARLDYVIRYTPDVAKLTRFYRETFGFPVRVERFEGAYVELDAGGVTLALCALSLRQSALPELGRADGSAEPTGSGVQISFQTTDVAGTFERALAAGGVAVTAPGIQPWRCEVAVVRDPDGLLIELCRRLDSISPG